MHALLEVAASHQRVLRTAGNKENPQLRPQCSGCIGNLAPVYATRKTDIGNQKVDSRSRLQDPQSRRAAPDASSTEYPVSASTSAITIRIRLVIDHQGDLAFLPAAPRFALFGHEGPLSECLLSR
jgi:hypothetical protein